MAKTKHKVKKSSASKIFVDGTAIKAERANPSLRKQVILVLKPQRRIKINYSINYIRNEINEKFIKRHKVSKKIKSKIDDFICEYNLQLDSMFEEIGLVYVSGSIENLEKAFKVELHQFEYKEEIKRYRQSILGHEGNFYLPENIVSFVSGVIGLSDVPLMHNVPDSNTLDQDNFFSAAIGLKPSWFADHYGFPKGYSGKGQKIAIVSCGGGITKKNIDHYFDALGIKNYPELKYISVGGVKNLPGISFIYDLELATDCLISMATALETEVVIYGTVNTLKGLADAVLEIVYAGKNGPKIISYSWGAIESNYSSLEIKWINRILKYATLAKGITILCAAGDWGSTNNYQSNKDTPLAVQFPASSPWVIACGGTKIKTNEEGNVVSEEVWNTPNFLYDILIPNASGGGFSTENARPDYQIKALKNRSKLYPQEGRGVPDISAHADMSPSGIGYWVSVNSEFWMGGGTSAVAPLMAALMARINEACKEPVGFLNPLLYEMASTKAITSINKGNNAILNGPKKWMARKGWDPCTGLGIPNGNIMLQYIKKARKR